MCEACVIGNEDDERACPKCPTAPTKTDGFNSRIIHTSSSDTFVRPSAKIEALLRNLHKSQVATGKTPTKRYDISMDTIFGQFTSLIFRYQRHIQLLDEDARSDPAGN